MSRQRIVVVEDDRSTRIALRSLFSRMGYEVTLAATVADGFCLLDPAPDYLILDLMLPDGEGADLLRWVRSAQLPTRVAVTTGMGDHDRLEAVSALQPDGLLSKPVCVSALCRALSGRKARSPQTVDGIHSADHEQPNFDMQC